jgi:mRNA-degrading endonuclease YafQ of YafQ-DinJ toxin-antitoxin module
MEEIFEKTRTTVEKIMKVLNEIKNNNELARQIADHLHAQLHREDIKLYEEYKIEIETEARPFRVFDINRKPYICVDTEKTIKRILFDCKPFRDDCVIYFMGEGAPYHTSISAVDYIGAISVDKIIKLMCNMTEKDFDMIIERLRERGEELKKILEMLKQIIALIKMILS